VWTAALRLPSRKSSGCRKQRCDVSKLSVCRRGTVNTAQKCICPWARCGISSALVRLRSRAAPTARMLWVMLRVSLRDLLGFPLFRMRQDRHLPGRHGAHAGRQHGRVPLPGRLLLECRFPNVRQQAVHLQKRHRMAKRALRVPQRHLLVSRSPCLPPRRCQCPGGSCGKTAYALPRRHNVERATVPPDGHPMPGNWCFPEAACECPAGTYFNKNFKSVPSVQTARRAPASLTVDTCVVVARCQHTQVFNAARAAAMPGRTY
jgi:hypothetical protein